MAWPRAVSEGAENLHALSWIPRRFAEPEVGSSTCAWNPQMGEKEGGKEEGWEAGEGVLTEQMYVQI